MHQVCQLLYHALVLAEIILLGQHDAKVEYELIAVVAGRLHADRVSEDAISICAHLKEVATELLARDHEERDVGKGEEEGLPWRGGGGDDGSVGDLVDDFGALRQH